MLAGGNDLLVEGALIADEPVEGALITEMLLEGAHLDDELVEGALMNDELFEGTITEVELTLGHEADSFHFFVSMFLFNGLYGGFTAILAQN